MTEEEILTSATEIAKNILQGRITARRGATDIWLLSAENHDKCFEELKRFIGVASQWSETPQFESEFTEDVRQAAQDLIEGRQAD
jgi:hypothetical protein